MAGKQPRPTGAGEGIAAPARPMAVREITIEDKVEAMEARVAALEKIVDEHQRYHFGRKP